jgi:hypothetical protein
MNSCTLHRYALRSDLSPDFGFHLEAQISNQTKFNPPIKRTFKNVHFFVFNDIPTSNVAIMNSFSLCRCSFASGLFPDFNFHL